MGIYDTLNEPQLQAVMQTEGPVLILAGAGSGKTRVLTHRAAYLVEEKGVSPYHIMAITFTNKAAGEMRERIQKIVGYGAEGIWVTTFHSTCVRILRRFINRIGFETNFTIYDADDQKSLMKDICKRLEIDTKLFKEKMFLSAISSAKDRLTGPDEFAREAPEDYTVQKQAQVYKEYQQALKKNNALDFDDLIFYTVKLFEADEQVLSHYQERFQYIMVDEYQDTNTVQFWFVSLLAKKYRNLCVVGDDDQSIYKFRGANIKNILNFEQVFEDARVIKLEQNYRSTSNILNAANAVIRNNRGRKDKTLWTDNGEGKKLTFRQFDSGYDEAEYIVDDIRKQVNAGSGNCHDFAILYRTNAQSRIFEEKFVTANIPYRIVGGINFYARREIKDILAYLKTIDNAKDDIAVRRIVNVPKRGIGLTSINRVQEYALARELGFYEALLGVEHIPNIGRGKARLESFAALIEHFKADAGKLGISELTDEILEETGYIEELKSESELEAEARLENIDELKNKMIAYEEQCAEQGEPITLSGFLEEVALVADIDSLNEESDYVMLMTLHSAKGLEFPCVYLAGLEDGIFPSYLSITSDDHEEVEEERRLCYVGLTRAKQELTLTCAKRRMIRGEMQYNKMSRFLKEIPEEYLSDGEPFKKEKAEPEFRNVYKHAKQSFHNKAFQARPVQQFQVSGSSGPGYDVGDRVRHVKFGDGLVTGITEGGRDYEVTVEFDTAGKKKMFAGFARLKKIEE